MHCKSLRITSICSFLTLFVSMTHALGQSDSLLLNWVIEQALENNPAIQVSKSSIDIAAGNWQASFGEFNTSYHAYLNQSRSITPNTLDFREGIFGVTQQENAETRLLTYGLGASKKLYSGTILSSGLELSNFGKDNLYEKLLLAGRGELVTNRSGVYFTVTQPLLFGRGKKFNTADLRANKANIQAEKKQYVFEVSSILLDVVTAYVNYIAAQKNLEIQQQTEGAYQKVVHDLKRLVELDQLPRAELLFIQANASAQSRNRTFAENNLAFTRNLLGQVMGISQEAIQNLSKPPEQFPIQEVVLPDSGYLNQWVKKSLEARHDYKSFDELILANQITLDKSRQGLKPRLDLDLSIGYNGIYEGNGLGQFFQPFTKNVPGLNYSVGLSFDIAPKFDAEKGDIATNLAVLDQSKYQQQVLQNQIHLNVKRFYDQLRYFSNVVELSKQAVNFNEIALKNEFTKLKLGSSTVINVVQIQNNYVVSLNALNRALQDLNLAFFQFKFHTGTLLSVDESLNYSVDFIDLLQLPQINR